MSLAKDPLLRQLNILQVLPLAPGRIATTTMVERMRELGFDSSERTIQRDLNKLSTIFPIIVFDDSKPYRWSLDSSFTLSTPSAKTDSALAITMAEPLLKRQLPASVFSFVSREREKSKQILGTLKQNTFIKWQDKIRNVQSGVKYGEQSIDNAIWEVITTSLLEDRQISVNYYSRKSRQEKALTLSPLGLVNKSNKTYLVAVARGYIEPTIYALHRFRQATLLQSKAIVPDGFTLDKYIETGALAWSEPNEPRHLLVANISSDLAFTLQECPINDTQELKALECMNSEYQLKVSVPNNKETLWWLFGLNREVTVLEPSEWKEIIRTTIEEQLIKYQKLEENGAK